METSWHNSLVGLVDLVLYYGASSLAWGAVVSRILPIRKAMSCCFGFLVGFYLSAFAIGIPVVAWKYDRLSVAIAMVAVLIVGIFVSLRAKAKQSYRRVRYGLLINIIHRDYKIASVVRQWANSLAMTLWLAAKDKLVILFVFLSALFLFFIFHSRTGVYILSPWAALSPFVLMLFFVLCFMVVKMIFSSRPVWLVLSIIIIFSYLTHAYLPAVYETGFGGDKWRHLGAEKWLQDGNIYTPSLWGESARSDVRFGPIALPEALVAGNKTSYAGQWATTIMLSEALGVDIFLVDLLLVFLLWSLFLPLILYLFGRTLPLLYSGGGWGEVSGIPNERIGLLFAFLPTLFYTFQSEGAITIPVSFGHLFFFFVLLVWMQYVKTGKKSALYFASILTLAFYWGYILNFFMLILIGVLSVAWRKLFVDRKHWYKFKLKYAFSDKRLAWRDRTIFGLLIIASIFAIPFLEIFQGLSQYAPNSISASGIIGALADAFGQLSGFIGIVVPPDFIDQGNFLYNQTKMSLSRLPLFSYRLVPFIVSMMVWVIVWWAVYRIFRHRHSCHSERSVLTSREPAPSMPEGNPLYVGFAKFKGSLGSTILREYASDGSARDDNKTIILIAIIFIITMLSYFISWSFTEGIHILARRLNETIVFFMILFLGYGIWLFLSDARMKIVRRKKILAICFVLSFAATSTYASGPKLQMVTKDELRAAQIVWNEHQNDPEPYCVLANTWPLLGVEAVSGMHIVAGNFPVYKEYAQPERVKIFEAMSKSPSQQWITGAFRITGAEVCYYMTEKQWLSDNVFDKTVELLGEPQRVGTVYIWRLEKQ